MTMVGLPTSAAQSLNQLVVGVLRNVDLQCVPKRGLATKPDYPGNPTPQVDDRGGRVNLQPDPRLERSTLVSAIVVRRREFDE